MIAVSVVSIYHARLNHYLTLTLTRYDSENHRNTTQSCLYTCTVIPMQSHAVAVSVFSSNDGKTERVPI